MQNGLEDDLYLDVANYYRNDKFTTREKLAIEYAEQFSIDHRGVSDDLMARLRAAFSDTEVLELAVLCGLCVGIGRTFVALGLARDFDINWTADPAHSH
jgi:alkylhydroperoxidase family enzyme